MLAEKGIDVNADNSMLGLVPATTTDELVHLPDHPPTTEVTQPQVPPPGFIDEATRLKEIAKIQRQLIKRRRRKLVLLILKLAFFVFLPTLLVGYYYYALASKMYETQSAFVIQKSEANSSPVGGLFSGTGFANSVDSITVQDYLTSREAMQRLDDEHGFVAHFQQEFIDEVQRLAPDATLEAAYKLYRKRVKVGFDSTEGVIRMDVVAADPQVSQTFASALIVYAEERVDQLSQRVRTDQMAGALSAFEDAETEVKGAQNRVLDLQQERGVLSADVEISAQMSLINSLELEREQKLLDLAQLEANARPNDTRLNVLRAELRRLETRVAELRASMTQSSDSTTSLARISGELAVAEADLANRQLMLQSALQQVETARIEANRQVRYLSLGVSPVAPDVATYPKKFESTVLAFLIFGGIYILMSLTVSILREQVSV